jgi:hypothetical protein
MDLDFIKDINKFMIFRGDKYQIRIDLRSFGRNLDDGKSEDL